MVSFAAENDKVAQNVFTAISNVLDMNSSTFVRKDPLGLAARSLAGVVDAYARKLTLPRGGLLTIDADNLSFETRQLESRVVAAGETSDGQDPGLNKQQTLIFKSGPSTASTVPGGDGKPLENSQVRNFMIHASFFSLFSLTAFNWFALPNQEQENRQPYVLVNICLN